METQDPRKPTHSGHEGGHICNKCGWPFPNPHPSARHRRAHRKVCGTIEGYKVGDGDGDGDGDADTAIDKPNVEVSDGEHVSDDDHKTPGDGGKVVEGYISKRSGTGIGNRSIRSTRSEDDVFADAVTDFVEGSSPQEAGMLRGNSLQNILEEVKMDDDAELAFENATTGFFTPSSSFVKDEELTTIKTMEGENDKLEATQLSLDHNCSYNNLDTGVVEGQEVSNKEPLEHTIPFNENVDEVSVYASVGGITGEPLNSVSDGGMLEPTGKQTVGLDNEAECSSNVDSHGNPLASIHSVQDVEAVDSNTSNFGNVVDESISNSEANQDVYTLGIPSALPLQENPDIALVVLDHKGGKINISNTPDAALEVESLKIGEVHPSEESCCNTDFAAPRESNDVSVDDVGDLPESTLSVNDMLIPEFGRNKSVFEPNTGGELDQISDVKACDADMSEFSSKGHEAIKEETLKDQNASGSTEKHQPIISLQNVASEVATVDGGGNLEVVAKGGSDGHDVVKLDGKDFVAHDNDASAVPVGELTVTSPTLTEPNVDDVASQVKEPADDYNGNAIDYDEKVKVEATDLNENELSIGGEEANERVDAKSAPVDGCSDKNDELFELKRSHDQGKLDVNIDADNVLGDSPRQEGLTTSLGVTERENAEYNMAGGESIIIDNMAAVRTSADHPDSILTMREDNGVGSAVAADSCTEKIADNMSSVNLAGRISKEHTAVSAVDNVDSGSQNSVEGNWGSVSVLSTVSDASLAIDLPASMSSPALAEAGSSISSEPKTGGELQVGDKKTSFELQPQVPVEQVGASEIKASQNELQQSSTLQTVHSPLVAHVANEPPVGKMEEEIIAKVNDWNSGKEHTALKTLLGEANAKSRAESPSHNEDSTPAPQADVVPVKKNGFSAKTENVIIGSEGPKSESAKEEIGKEWNSPARYPVSMKTEKRRAKGRSYWTPFLCCSSVNAR